MTEKTFWDYLKDINNSIDASLKISRAYLLEVLSKTDKENVVMIVKDIENSPVFKISVMKWVDDGINTFTEDLVDEMINNSEYEKEVIDYRISLDYSTKNYDQDDTLILSNKDEEYIKYVENNINDGNIIKEITEFIYLIFVIKNMRLKDNMLANLNKFETETINIVRNGPVIDIFDKFEKIEGEVIKMKNKSINEVVEKYNGTIYETIFKKIEEKFDNELLSDLNVTINADNSKITKIEFSRHTKKCKIEFNVDLSALYDSDGNILYNKIDDDFCDSVLEKIEEILTKEFNCSHKVITLYYNNCVIK